MTELHDYVHGADHSWGHNEDHHNRYHAVPYNLPQKRSLYAALTGDPDIEWSRLFQNDGEIMDTFDRPIVY